MKKKEQASNMIRWAMVLLTTYPLFIIIEMLIAFSIFENNSSFAWFIMVIITLCGYVIILIKQYRKNKKIAENFKQKGIEKAKKELTSEFRKVVLNGPKSIPEEYFQCEAKMDNDGKIIVRIRLNLDYEIEMKDYEEFFWKFHFAQD